MNNEEKHPIRPTIESTTNFLKKQPQFQTTQLGDNSKPEYLGDPLTTDLNQMDGPTGSDSTKPTVSVKPGTQKGGNDSTTGQHKANFQPKTELAENNSPDSENMLRQYLVKVLEEQFDAMLNEQAHIEEVVDELLGEPSTEKSNKEESENIESEGMATNLAMGRGNNLRPTNYPVHLTRNK